jgi:glycosyltransferase involved in cell wall biosynthesis
MHHDLRPDANRGQAAVARMSVMTDDDGIMLTILMPCLNEARSLPTCIAEAKSYLARHRFLSEIVVADNGSTDGSPEIARSLGARVVQVEQIGYGHALIAGISAARGKFVIMGDADNSYDFSALDPFLEKLLAGNDLVIGNRFRGGIEKGAMPRLHRYFGNPLLTMVGRTLYSSDIGDFTCGLRGFRRDAMMQLDLSSHGMEFALEMIVKSAIRRLSIAEVPTTLSPDTRGRPPHLRSWRDGWRSLRFFLALSPESVFLYPGLALALVSGAVSLYLSLTDIRLGSVTLSFHTLIVTSALTVAGMQSMAFWLFAKALAIQRKLLFPDPLFARLRASFSLEKCLIVAAGLTTAAFVIACYALIYWANRSFGSITVGSLVKTVCAASFLLIAGLQLAFSAFFFYLLDQGDEHL